MIGGGISKTRYSKKLSSIASGHPDGTDALLIQQEQNIAISDTKQANEDLSFADSSMSSAARGVAGRLVMYSQKLISSSEYVPTLRKSAFLNLFSPLQAIRR